MSRILLFHHLGLGDHVMCHGIVREYCKRYDHVTIFSWPHNYPSVSFMFRDLDNLSIIQSNVESARTHIAENAPEKEGSPYDEIRIIGFENLNRRDGVPLEKQFYDLAGVPLSKKWEGFYVERDFEKEQDLFYAVAPKVAYAFLHEDLARKYIIKRKYIGREYAVFMPDAKLTDNIFDYCTAIEQAREVHVIDSSFMFLIDCLSYENPNQKLYIHRYARENSEWQLPILRKDWNILTAEPGILDPLREFLERLYQVPLFPFNTRFFKRTVRWFFRCMLWTMGRPKKLDIPGIIKHYAPEQSFAEVGMAGRYLDAALSAGATNARALNEAGSADVVLYAGNLPHDLPSFLRRLRTATRTTLLFVVPTRASTVPALTAALEEAGFGVREKQIFRTESCFVCRAL